MEITDKQEEVSPFEEEETQTQERSVDNIDMTTVALESLGLNTLAGEGPAALGIMSQRLADLNERKPELGIRTRMQAAIASNDASTAILLLFEEFHSELVR
jgi:hypothetical protein